MSKLLINEPPLQVLPTLAKAIGLNEAIVLQQIHYWISNPKIGKVRDERRWVRNSIKQWSEDNFPFWSVRTIRRIFINLEKEGYIESGNLNDVSYDRTLWYTIVYSKLEEHDNDIPNHLPQTKNPLGQNGQMEVDKVATSLTKTTSKSKKEEEVPAPAKPKKKGIEYPPHLDTPEFHAKWEEWRSYRREIRKGMKPTTERLQLNKLVKIDASVEEASWIIDLSREKGWTGLYPERILERRKQGGPTTDCKQEIRKAVSGYGRTRFKEAYESMPETVRETARRMGYWSDVCGMNEYQFDQAYRAAVKGG